MDKDIGKIKKNENTDIIVRIDDYGGKRGVTIREFVTGETYTGFTKSGTRIPAEVFLAFRELVNSIDLSELTSEVKSAEVKKEKQQKVTEENEEEGLL